MAVFLAGACVTIRKRKLSHWCGRNTGSYGCTTCIYRKTLQFPVVTLATVCPILSRYQSHLKVIPRQRVWNGSALQDGQWMKMYIDTQTAHFFVYNLTNNKLPKVALYFRHLSLKWTFNLQFISQERNMIVSPRPILYPSSNPIII